MTYQIGWFIHDVKTKLREAFSLNDKDSRATFLTWEIGSTIIIRQSLPNVPTWFPIRGGTRIRETLGINEKDSRSTFLTSGVLNYSK